VGKLAPIFLTTYRRLDHVKATVSALQEDALARDSILIITSDGPSRGHEKEVHAVRDYLSDVHGFHSVKLLFFEENDRRQIWKARRRISEQYGKYIFLEEDCVPSKGLLTFLNQGLTLYETKTEIFGICGYFPPVSSDRLVPGVYACPSFNSWGFATWHRSESIVKERLSDREYENLIKSFPLMGKIRKHYSPLLLALVHKIQIEELYAFDVMARLAMIENDQRCVFPSKSLVKNIGLDGSGEHCGSTSKFDVEVGEGDPFILESPAYAIDKELDLALARFYGSNLTNLLRFYWKYFRGKFRSHRV
jgi:hypothetical protein